MFARPARHQHDKRDLRHDRVDRNQDQRTLTATDGISTKDRVERNQDLKNGNPPLPEPNSATSIRQARHNRDRADRNHDQRDINHDKARSAP